MMRVTTLLPEKTDLEFKKTTGQLERGMESLCAFLNGQGGTVLFGASDDGVISGQEVADSTGRDFAEALRRFEPQAAVEVSYIGIPDPEFHTDGSAVWVVFHYKPYESGQDRPSSPQVADAVRIVYGNALSVNEIMDALALRDRKIFCAPISPRPLNTALLHPCVPINPIIRDKNTD